MKTKEEYLEAIGDKQVFVQDFHELPIKLQQEINQNRMKLKTINEVKYPLILLYFAVRNIFFKGYCETRSNIKTVV